MIPVPNLELVIIIPEKVEDTMKVGGKELVKSDMQKDSERKAQNRGTVFAVGGNVAFWEKGDFVSFYLGRSTEIKEDGVTYVSVEQNAILCKFVSHV